MSRRKPKPEHSSSAPAEKAFRRSDGYYFNGKKLQPWSWIRKSALFGIAEAMGVNPLTQLQAIMWLLHQPDSVVLRARRLPDDYVSAVDKFADEHLCGENVQIATALLDALNEDENNATGKPATDEAEDTDDDEGN